MEHSYRLDYHCVIAWTVNCFDKLRHFMKAATEMTFWPQHPAHTLSDFNRKIKMIQPTDGYYDH